MHDLPPVFVGAVALSPAAGARPTDSRPSGSGHLGGHAPCACGQQLHDMHAVLQDIREDERLSCSQAARGAGWRGSMHGRRQEGFGEGQAGEAERRVTEVALLGGGSGEADPPGATRPPLWGLGGGGSAVASAAADAAPRPRRLCCGRPRRAGAGETQEEGNAFAVVAKRMLEQRT